MRLEACEEGKKVPGGKNNMSGGPKAGRGLGSYRCGKGARGWNKEQEVGGGAGNLERDTMNIIALQSQEGACVP